MSNGGCSEIYEADKEFSGTTLFGEYPARMEDIECDSQTFAASGTAAIWSVNAYDNIVNAWAIDAASCVGPVSHWTFEEGSGTTANDIIGPNEGTLTNMSARAWVSGHEASGSKFVEKKRGESEFINLQRYARIPSRINNAVVCRF
jgi:hypothetical protein